MVAGTRSFSIAKLDKKLEEDWHSELFARIEQMNLGMDEIRPMLHEKNECYRWRCAYNVCIVIYGSNVNLTSYYSTRISKVEGLGLQWHLNYITPKFDIYPSWTQYVADVITRFGDPSPLYSGGPGEANK